MTELTQQAFDRMYETAKNAIKERDVARDALQEVLNAWKRNEPSVTWTEGFRNAEEAITFRAEGSEK